MQIGAISKYAGHNLQNLFVLFTKNTIFHCAGKLKQIGGSHVFEEEAAWEKLQEGVSAEMFWDISFHAVVKRFFVNTINNGAHAVLIGVLSNRT